MEQLAIYGIEMKNKAKKIRQKKAKVYSKKKYQCQPRTLELSWPLDFCDEWSVIWSLKFQLAVRFIILSFADGKIKVRSKI